jgi:hypothetical protein
MSSSGSISKCRPGKQKVGDRMIERFCGPARATVRLGGRRYTFASGRCKVDRTARLYVVDIGVATEPPARPTSRYFSVRSKKLTPGVTTTGAVALIVNRRWYTVAPNTITLSARMKSGTFRGGLLFGSGTASGSWSCG